MLATGLSISQKNLRKYRPPGAPEFFEEIIGEENQGSGGLMQIASDSTLNFNHATFKGSSFNQIFYPPLGGIAGDERMYCPAGF